jgi:hypothetical protein
MSDTGSSSSGGDSGGVLSGITSSFSKPGDAGLSSTGTGGGGFGVKDFMESNSLVAKFAFILMVFIVLYFSIKLAIIGLSYILLPTMAPYVLNGTANTEDMVITIPQDPAKNNSIFISRSTNEDGGLEYTWSTWFFIKQVPIQKDKFSRIFSKGGEGTKSSTNGIYYPNNAPGLYIKFTDDVTPTNPDRTDKGVNVTLMAVVDVSGKSENRTTLHENLHEKLLVTDIPIKNWVSAIIRVTNNVIDLYINGRLAQRIKTAGIPLQNYGNVNIGEAKQANRFSGYISTIQYFNYSIGSSKIKSIVDEGPIMKMVTNTGAEASTQDTNYLSNNWFLR